MVHFVRARGLSLAGVVLVMVFISALQAGISYSITVGPLEELESNIVGLLLAALYAVRIAFLLALTALWALNRKHALFRTIIAANTFFTLVLLVDVIVLMRVLGGFEKAAPTLLIDAALMSLSNMLIFRSGTGSLILPASKKTRMRMRRGHSCSRSVRARCRISTRGRLVMRIICSSALLPTLPSARPMRCHLPAPPRCSCCCREPYLP
jgi:hypothetical protein